MGGCGFIGGMLGNFDCYWLMLWGIIYFGEFLVDGICVWMVV